MPRIAKYCDGDERNTCLSAKIEYLQKGYLNEFHFHYLELLSVFLIEPKFYICTRRHVDILLIRARTSTATEVTAVRNPDSIRMYMLRVCNKYNDFYSCVCTQA